MDIAEDVARTPYTIKKKDALHADSALEPKWEDMMVGLKKSELEEVKEPEEWDIWKIFQEEPKTDSEVAPPLNPKIEKPFDPNDLFLFNQRHLLSILMIFIRKLIIMVLWCNG